MNFRSGLLLLPILSILYGAGHVFILSAEKSQKKDEKYYTAEDFKSVKKFDTHIHINTDEAAFIKLSLEDNFRFLDIVDDRPFGLPMAEQQKFAFQHLKNFPGQMEVATTFSVKGFNDKYWAENTIRDLKQSISKGARAVKIWKNLGLDLCDQN